MAIRDVTKEAEAGKSACRILEWLMRELDRKQTELKRYIVWDLENDNCGETKHLRYAVEHRTLENIKQMIRLEMKAEKIEFTDEQPSRESVE